jgi:hypothetical protein
MYRVVPPQLFEAPEFSAAKDSGGETARPI